MDCNLIDKVNQDGANSSAEIFEALHNIVHLIRSEQYKVFHNCPYALTHMEGTILCFFARNPGATLSALAAYTGRDKGQLARLIKALREHGLLSASEDASDKRSVRLELSELGAKVQGKLRLELAHATDLALRSLDADARVRLLVQLREMRANIEQP